MTRCLILNKHKKYTVYLGKIDRAEFNQTIEPIEHTWNSFGNIWIFWFMQSHAEHSAVKWASFFSSLMNRRSETSQI